MKQSNRILSLLTSSTSFTWNTFKRVYRKGFVRIVPGDDIEYVGHTMRYILIIVDILILVIMFRPVDYVLGHTFARCDIVPMEIIQKTTLGETLTVQDKRMISSIVKCRALSQMLELAIILSMYVLFWVKYSFTPAMFLFGMRILRANDLKKMSIYDALKRVLGILISILPVGIGFFWMMFDKKSQGWHDKISGTVIIRKSCLVKKN
ncbi:MAG: RDD containing domain protein [Candidatus Xenolissoclinum pacificiensis L6]|uniref:RDD containing domain protein n=1 Tax=Candidatus Xenolissoclinum pacificiensis L6 TaxID=1401685 RepID=W2UZL2_9RICK|nr:MAG: RDD containing domain protein [Candidatus Xenolissoclinum pacificiensis L6]